MTDECGKGWKFWRPLMRFATRLRLSESIHSLFAPIGPVFEAIGRTSEATRTSRSTLGHRLVATGSRCATPSPYHSGLRIPHPIRPAWRHHSMDAGPSVVTLKPDSRSSDSRAVASRVTFEIGLDRAGASQLVP